MQYFIFKNKEVSTYSSFFIKISSIFFDRSSYGIHSICQSLESLVTIQGCCRNHIKRCCYQIYLKRQWTTSSDYAVLFCLNVKSICILNNFQVSSLMPSITLARFSSVIYKLQQTIPSVICKVWASVFSLNQKKEQQRRKLLQSMCGSLLHTQSQTFLQTIP